ncbi:MAG: FAD-dependent oxidoreductase [Planctomycetota bacterium]
MDTDVLIVGGGASGLTAAWALKQAGVNATLIEARHRLGGRILTTEPGMHDLGPSWFWPGQPRIAALLQRFGITFYEQFDRGDVLFQQFSGEVFRNPGPSPMSGALRAQGGIGQLIQSLYDEVEPASIRLQHRLEHLCVVDHGIIATIQTPQGTLKMTANRVALAVPPRLAAQFAYDPPLPVSTTQALEATPTWMAGHAKFFASYERPFWRDQGLCGSGFSQSGPLGEFHDASTPDQELYSLFGFVRLDAGERATLSPQALIDLALTQLVQLFGPEAATPIATHLQDWSTEPFTSTPADHTSQLRHNAYGLSLDTGDWGKRLALIATETAYEHGGLIEGALEAALNYASELTKPR